MNSSINPFDRQKWRHGFHFDQQYSTNSFAMTVSKSTHPSPSAPAVLTSWGSIGVSIALPECYIAFPVSFLNTSTSRCIASRYGHTSPNDLFSCLVRSGTADFLREHPLMTWVTASILATSTPPVRHQIQEL